jgi:hypothetical protein
LRTEDLKKRTKEFVIRVINLFSALPKKKLDSLLKEANELMAIFVRNGKTAKAKK